MDILWTGGINLQKGACHRRYSWSLTRWIPSRLLNNPLRTCHWNEKPQRPHFWLEWRPRQPEGARRAPCETSLRLDVNTLLPVLTSFGSSGAHFQFLKKGPHSKLTPFRRIALGIDVRQAFRASRKPSIEQLFRDVANCPPLHR